MKKCILFLLAPCLLVSVSIQIAAQSAVPPPKILLIVREEIKTGMMPAHSAEANNVVRIYAKARSPHYRLAMVPVAGNENEVMYFWGFDSFAALEKSNKDLDTIATVTYKADFDKIRPPGDDYHTSQRDSIAVFRDDLSYRAATDIARMRYMRVQTVRVKPGHVRDFENGRRMIKAAHEKARVDENMAVYQLVAGAQGNTYLVLIPWNSLDGLGTLPHGKDYRDAMGDNNWDKLDKIDDESIVFNAVDVYAFNPQLSYMSPQAVSVDPGFWTLRPMTTATSPAPRKAGKTAANRQ
ncbi:MAG: hypothetical protein H0V90_05875 [Blastocatellia bacterium]|nr:hypothetical protein [Blastocatellia bacterium]